MVLDWSIEVIEANKPLDETVEFFIIFKSAVTDSLATIFCKSVLFDKLLDWETDSMLQLFAKVRKSSSTFEEAIRETLALVLVSPDFLYLVETRKDANPDKSPLNDFELASRLSYFLWSSMPDQTLFDLAKSGSLRNPDVLSGEVERMLDDPKSWQFVRQFSDQWLDLASVNRVAVNPQYYEKWDTSLEP